MHEELIESARLTIEFRRSNFCTDYWLSIFTDSWSYAIPNKIKLEN